MTLLEGAKGSLQRLQVVDTQLNSGEKLDNPHPDWIA